MQKWGGQELRPRSVFKCSSYGTIVIGFQEPLASRVGLCHNFRFWEIGSWPAGFVLFAPLGTDMGKIRAPQSWTRETISERQGL